jgi:hypothetical protein
MKILVGFEFSGRVRDAFTLQGHDATSCDIEPSETPGKHIIGDIRDIDLSSYEMAILFPPCTRLCRSGQRWIAERNLYKEKEEAIKMFLWCTSLPLEKIAIENPIGIMSTYYRKPDQIIQPWMHGCGEVKSTCLWLKNLPLLKHTNVVGGRKPSVHYEPPGPERAKNRSRTYHGIANAMSLQWSS